MTTVAADLAVLLMLWSNGAADACHVTRAVDGDSVGLACGGAPERIYRVWGIDAPERGEPGFTEATDALGALLATDWLRARQMLGRTWGRDVIMLKTPEGDVACAMVAADHAEDWPYYSGGFYGACDHALRPKPRPGGAE